MFHCWALGPTSRVRLAAGFIGLLSLSAGPASTGLAQAVRVPGVFSTGLSDSGTLLEANARDPHWDLTASPDASYPGPATWVVQDGFPIPPWLANSPESRWIGPRADAGAGAAAGNYTYTTRFSLADFDPTTAVLTGRWSSDNSGVDILHREDTNKVIAYRRHGASGEDVIVILNLRNKSYKRYDNVSEMYAVAEVYEGDLPRVELGQPAVVKLFTGAGDKLAGEVAEIGMIVAKTTHQHDIVHFDVMTDPLAEQLIQVADALSSLHRIERSLTGGDCLDRHRPRQLLRQRLLPGGAG